MADYDYIVHNPQTVQLSGEDRDLFRAILDAVRHLGGPQYRDIEKDGRDE